MKGALQSRGGDQKMSPCDGKRGDGMVYTFAPGATITLAVNEDIPHPSYFRVSFDDDGEDFVEPLSIDPIDKTRACPFDPDDQCGKADYCTQAGVAKGARVLWDNLDPHLAADAKGGSWNVKLPDVECDNCTIQVLQIMEDTVHGAYCPQGTCAASANSLEDIYHRCVDIKLVKGAPSGPGATTDAIKNMGVDCATAGGEAAAGAGGASGAAATSGSAGTGSSGSGGASGTTTTAGRSAGEAAASGSGGAAAASSGAAGAKSTAAAGSSAASGASMGSASGSAGKPAASTTAASGSTAPKAGSAAPSTGTSTSPSTSSDGATGMTTPSSGGCAVSSAAGADANGASFALLSLIGLFFAGRRKRQ
jgi:MYXO-CTERM domain-containing protein